MAVEEWVSLPAELSSLAWQARHRDAEVQDVYLRERLLLAWASRGNAGGSRLGVLQDSEDEQGFLGGKDTAESGAGHEGAA